VLSAIPRYGARIIPNTEQTIAAARARGQLVEGPHIAEFEKAFAARMGASHAVATSYGHMAFLYLLDALAGAKHVFYQYAIHAKRRQEVVRTCLRRGLDIESLHVDVCTRLPLFANGHRPVPGAERAGEAIQVPVYSSLKIDDVDRIASVVREAVGA